MKKIVPDPWFPGIHILAWNKDMMKNDSDEWQNTQMYKVLQTVEKISSAEGATRSGKDSKVT